MRKISVFLLALVMTAGLGSVAFAQSQPAPSDSRPANTDVVDHRDHGTGIGWLGLLGLVGLFGLKRREPDTVRTTRTANATR